MYGEGGGEREVSRMGQGREGEVERMLHKGKERNGEDGVDGERNKYGGWDEGR